MNDPLLIEKHLADGLTDEEAAALEVTLADGPAAVRRLVAAARLDEQLTAKLGAGRPEPTVFAELKRGGIPARLNQRWRRPLAAAAALVAVLGLVAAVLTWVRSTNSSQPETVSADVPTNKRPFVPAPLVLASDFPGPPQHETKETPAMVSLRRFLSSYHLTDLKLEQPRPLAEAVGRLLQRARELNHLHNPVIERLSAEVGDADDGDERADTVVRLPLKDLSLMDGLKWIGALARSEVFLEEPGVITFRPWEPDESEALVTEVLRVRPDLLTRRASEDEIRGAEAGANNSGWGTDPFTGSGENSPVRRLSADEWLQSWGITVRRGATALFNEATAELTLQQSASNIRLIKALLAVESSRLASMVDIHTKLFEFTEHRAVENELLTEKQFQVWLRDQNQVEGVSLLSAPQITIRSGQRGMVEVGGGLVRPVDEETRQTDAQEEWRALRIPIEPVFEGEVVKVVGAVELRLPVNRQAGALIPAETIAPGEQLVTTATDFEAMVPQGQTAVFSVSGSAEGPQIVMTMTVHSVPLSSVPLSERGVGEGSQDEEAGGGERVGP